MSPPKTRKRPPCPSLACLSPSNGLVSASRTSRRSSKNIMSSIFDIPGVFIYIDDVIIVASTFDEFLDKIRAVLSNARSRRVNIGLQKCTFTTCNHPIKILGHVFFKKTRSIDSFRISALVELPPPKNVKEVRSFVGSVNYLRDWLPQISEELAPIIELTRGSESGNRAPPIK
ncbi:hypothetical protein RCL1_000235 [Eukaryota sp. TZLM3-RCL]